MNAKKRVALYIRVSTQEQADKFGLPVQLNQMKKWLETYEDLFTWDEKHLYTDDGFSGASEIFEREALPKLFEAARKKEFDVILVWKLDRFFRKTRYLLNAIEELKEMDIGFIATTQAEVDTTKTMGKFMLGLLGIIAEMERDLIIERTGIGRMEAANAGKFVGGMHTYGYDIDEQTQKITINPETSKIVRLIFKWFVKDRLNSYQVQQRINAMNIPTQADLELERMKKKKGAENVKKSKRKVNPANFWHGSTIRKILKNQAYTGHYFFNKKTRKYNPTTKKWKEAPNPREEWIKVICPKIIEGGVWKTAQALLKRNEKSQRRGKDIYLISGKIICGACNSPYHGYMKAKFKTKNKVREIVSKKPHYRCGKDNASKVGVPCANRQISGTALEALVWSRIEELISDPDIFIKRVEQEERKKVNVRELEKERDTKQKELDEIIAETDRMLVLFQKGLKYQGKGELEKESSRLEADEKRLENDLESIASQLMDAEERQERLASAKNLAKKYAKSLTDLDFPTKRTIVQDIVKRVVILPEKVRIELLIAKKAGKGGEDDRNETLYGVTGWD